jgi:hypothetical protein
MTRYVHDFIIDNDVVICLEGEGGGSRWGTFIPTVWEFTSGCTLSVASYSDDNRRDHLDDSIPCGVSYHIYRSRGLHGLSGRLRNAVWGFPVRNVWGHPHVE